MDWREAPAHGEQMKQNGNGGAMREAAIPIIMKAHAAEEASEAEAGSVKEKRKDRMKEIRYWSEDAGDLEEGECVESGAIIIGVGDVETSGDDHRGRGDDSYRRSDGDGGGDGCNRSGGDGAAVAAGGGGNGAAGDGAVGGGGDDDDGERGTKSSSHYGLGDWRADRLRSTRSGSPRSSSSRDDRSRDDGKGRRDDCGSRERYRGRDGSRDRKRAAHERQRSTSRDGKRHRGSSGRGFRDEDRGYGRDRDDSKDRDQVRGRSLRSPGRRSSRERSSQRGRERRRGDSRDGRGYMDRREGSRDRKWSRSNSRSEERRRAEDDHKEHDRKQMQHKDGRSSDRSGDRRSSSQQRYLSAVTPSPPAYVVYKTESDNDMETEGKSIDEKDIEEPSDAKWQNMKYDACALINTVGLARKLSPQHRLTALHLLHHYLWIMGAVPDADLASLCTACLLLAGKVEDYPFNEIERYLARMQAFGPNLPPYVDERRVFSLGEQPTREKVINYEYQLLFSRRFEMNFPRMHDVMLEVSQAVGMSDQMCNDVFTALQERAYTDSNLCLHEDPKVAVLAVAAYLDQSKGDDDWPINDWATIVGVRKESVWDAVAKLEETAAEVEKVALAQSFTNALRVLPSTPGRAES